MTRELASLKYRIEKYKPSKILYVVGNEQSLHFQQLFAIAQLMGINPEIGEHVKYELVLGSEGKKFSTRQGNMVRAKEVIDKAIAAAQKIVDQKRQDLSRKEREKIAQNIGINALKYYMLKESRMAQIVFNPDAMLSLNGNSAPYLNYTYARFSSILSKTKKAGKANFNLLKLQEIELIKKMFAFQDSLEKAWQNLSPHPIASYLFELANKANKFYESTPILAESLEDRKNALIILVSAICKIMELGFEIIGIQVLDKI
jgi:arginyl-tRNA synthetase